MHYLRQGKMSGSIGIKKEMQLPVQFLCRMQNAQQQQLQSWVLKLSGELQENTTLRRQLVPVASLH